MSRSENSVPSGGWARQINLFCLAMGFFSRVPMPKNVQYSAEMMHEATRYFPMVGWGLALILLGVFHLCLAAFNLPVAVMLVVIASILLTGALHEDGLADSCDGFWGGMTPERKIDIMKDSRIGTYGTCALIGALGLKFIVLFSLAQRGDMWMALLVAYPLSRAMALTHVQDLPYVSHLGSIEKNKSDPLARKVAPFHLWLVIGSGVAPLLFLSLSDMSAVLIMSLLMRYALMRWMKHHIGGFTGDTLGAAQQIQELTIYLALLTVAGTEM